MALQHGITGLSRYIYGTTRLGAVGIPVEERVKMARVAMASGVWFHTSRQYDDALEVMGRAFDEYRAQVPKLIYKIGNNNLTELRASIKANLDPLGLKHMDVGQLCLGGEYAEEFRKGGQCFRDFQALKEEGLVKHFVMEVFPWTSQVPYEALKAGHTRSLVDAFIFYLNPLQRFAANPLWDLLQETNTPVIAMRTVCGAPVTKLRDVPGAAWTPYLQERAVAVAPIFERSGIKNWTEFCVRFAFSFPQVIATVGATSREANFNDFVRYGTAEKVEPLPAETLAELVKLQRTWSAEVDVHAKPWTM